MIVVERPNQEALTKAIVIYMDAIRPFLTRNLKLVSGRTPEEAVQESLPQEIADYFVENRPNADNLESAIEVSYVEHIIDRYWDEVFARYFPNRAGAFNNLYGVKCARNQVAHPAYRQDLDGNKTLKYLDALVYLLGAVGASDERETIAAIKVELENPGKLDRKAEEDYSRLEEQYKKTLDELEETRCFLWKAESDLEAANSKLVRAEFARRKADQEAQVAQVLLGQAIEVLQKEVAVRIEAEELPARKVRARQIVEQATQLMQGVFSLKCRQLRVAIARLEKAKRKEVLKNRQARRVMQSHKIFRAISRSTRGQHSADCGLLAKSTVVG